jgi:hypothetical protein
MVIRAEAESTTQAVMNEETSEYDY